MTTTYPNTVDTFVNPSGTDDTVLVSHASQHDNANDAILAIENALGINPQGSSATVRARLDSADARNMALSVALGVF